MLIISEVLKDKEYPPSHVCRNMHDIRSKIKFLSSRSNKTNLAISKYRFEQKKKTPENLSPQMERGHQNYYNCKIS